MIKRILVASLAIAALSFSAPVLADPPKPALKGPIAFAVLVKNNSQACVWVSVAYSVPITHPWVWMTGDAGKARFIHPGGYATFSDSTFQFIPALAEVKVEGTFMEHANCSGRHVREITAENRAIQIDSGVHAKATGFLNGTNAADYTVHVVSGFQGAR